jgi:HlyD family secretion protein
MSARSKVFPTLILLVVVGAAGASGWYFWRAKQAPKPPTLQTAAIARGPVVQTITSTGRLQPVVQVEVSSQISGLVDEVLVDYNDRVSAGQVIARINPATYQARVSQARAELANSRANYDLVRLNAERVASLFERNLVSQQEVDQSRVALRQAEAALSIREASLQQAEVDLERCTIYAPIDGIVLSRQIDVGRTVAASLNAPTLFIIAADLTQMQIVAAISEADVGSIRRGQTANFTVDAYPNVPFRGRVEQIRSSPNTRDNVVTYDTIISVENPDGRLLPGMTANVSVVVAERPDTLRVPNSALRVRLPDTVPVVRAEPAPATAGAASPIQVAAAGPAPASAPAPANPRGGAGDGSQWRGAGGGGRLFANIPPEARDRAREVMRELGIGGGGPPTPDQIAQLQRVLVERGIISAPTAPGEPVIVTRTVFVAPGGDPAARPLVPTTVRIGITDGVHSELIDGLSEGDVIVTGVLASGAPPPTAAGAGRSPFGGATPMRRF